MSAIFPIRALLVLLIGIALVSCSSDASNEPDLQPAVDVDLTVSVSEQELELARATFDTAKALWESSDVSAYTFKIGIQTVSLMSFEVVDGVVLTGAVVEGTGDDFQGLPQTVEAYFALLDEQISAFENGASAVPEPGECGAHFTMSFDPELGYPTYNDGLGPCDDGVGIAASVTVTN